MYITFKECRHPLNFRHIPFVTARTSAQPLMEDYLDEWHGYAFTGQYLGSGPNGQTGVEYVIFVFSPSTYLFAQHARLTAEELSALGGAEESVSAERVLQQEALNRAKKRIREKNFEQYAHYD